MLRDIAMAWAFGTQSSIAALLVAFRLSHLLRRVFGEGAMQTALIPLFEELRKEDRQRGAQFISHLKGALSLLLTLIIVIAMGGIWMLLQSHSLSEGNQEIAWLTCLMMPSLLFICLFGINASILQCEKAYFIPSAAPVLFNLIWIVGIGYTWMMVPEKAVTIIALFIILACFGQWLVTVPKTHAILKDHGNTPFNWKNWRALFSVDLLRLTKPLSLAVVGVAATQINTALDAIFARWASEEGPAFLWYAIRLQQLPLALIGVALSGAILPPLARAAKQEDSAKFQEFLAYGKEMILLWIIPITAMVFLFGDLSISLIFGHGDFTVHSAVETTRALWGYGIGLLPMAMILVVAPAFYASGDYKTPSLAATGSMVINVFLNTLFVGIFDWGAASIACATSFSALFNLAWLERALKGSYTKLSTTALKALLASGVGALATIAFQTTYGQLPLITNLAARLEMVFELKTTEQALLLGLSIGVFLAGFALAGKVLLKGERDLSNIRDKGP